jgi:hypothetical protein
VTHATIVMVLSALVPVPAMKTPPQETFTETVADGEILKVMPKGKLYTAVDPKQILRYYFRVAIKDQEIVLTQVPDEFGKSDFFDLRGSTEGYGVQRTFSLKPGKPVSFSYNVPGGGPAWTLSLQGITK